MEVDWACTVADSSTACWRRRAGVIVDGMGRGRLPRHLVWELLQDTFHVLVEGLVHLGSPRQVIPEVDFAVVPHHILHEPFHQLVDLGL